MKFNPNLDIKPFSQPVERFLISLLLLQNNTAKNNDFLQGFDWALLSNYLFSWHIVYEAAKKLNLNIPEPIASEIKKRYIQNVILNENRIRLISQIAKDLAALGIPLLFVKGSAELVHFHKQTHFLGLRDMKDIDFLCHPENIDKVHEYLESKGFTLYKYGLNILPNKFILKRFLLPKTKHGNYNNGQWNTLEAHTKIVIPEYQSYYPETFESLLWENSEIVLIDDIPIRVPKKEHLLVYCLCHGAGADSHNDIAYVQEIQGFDSPSSLKENNWLMRVNRRLDVYQLIFLYKMNALLNECKDTLDYNEVDKLIKRIKNDKIFNVYLRLTKSVFGDAFNLPIETLDINDPYYTEQRRVFLESYFPFKKCLILKSKSGLIKLGIRYPQIKKIYMFFKILLMAVK